MVDKKHTEQFHKNYIRGIKQLMADKPELTTQAAVAEYLGIGDMTLYKIMQSKSAPTVEQGIVLCLKGGFNANWVFLNKGEMSMQLQNTLNEVAKMLKK